MEYFVDWQTLAHLDDMLRRLDDARRGHNDKEAD
jgi:hypothetical protein